MTGRLPVRILSIRAVRVDHRVMAVLRVTSWRRGARRGISSTLVATLGLAALIAAAQSSGAESARVALEPGWSWFVSPNTGEAALIDGPTGVRVDHFPVAEPGDDIDVVQAGSDAVVVNRTTGTVRGVDGSTFAAAAPVPLTTPGDSQFDVLANEHVVWAVVRGGRLIQRIDADSFLPVGEPMPVRGVVAGAAITPDGSLWTSSETDEHIAAFRTSGEGPSGTIDGATGAQVVVVDATPVAINLSRDRLEFLDPSDAEVSHHGCLALPAPSSFAGSGPDISGVVVVTPQTGTVFVSETDGGCGQSRPFGEPTAGKRYGQPVTHKGRTFIPDHDAGTVIVVDIANPATAVAVVPLDLAGSEFRLSTNQGYVWFHDPRLTRPASFTTT